jgi:hypothetical protein
MKITRRAFFMLYEQPVGDEMGNVGDWLRRKIQRGAVPLPGGGGTETTNEQALPTAARNIGLRNARANMRRNDNGQQ